MPDFLSDSRVEKNPGVGSWRASLSPNWAVWGPNGGYLAAIAFRAMLGEARLPRPASFQCHFLAVGQFAPVEIRVERLGGGKRAESLRADVLQGDRMLLAATAWMVDDGLDGYEHDFGKAPAVPGPDAVRSYKELAGEEYEQWYPIWRSMEGRPLRWQQPPGPPLSQTWMRFTDTPITDRIADAVRQLFWMDFPGWNATISAHPWPFRYLTPNLDLTIQFHQFAPEEEWALIDGTVPVAADGLVGCNARLWTPSGRLLASGTSKHTCRPNPNYEQELAEARAQGLIPGDEPDR
jgi:acyl-CoA thioesterase